MIDSQNKIQYFSIDTLPLECGESLSNVQIAYHTYGQPNCEGNNVIWICHALTANSNVQDWWSGLVGIGKLIDPSRYFIVCANIIGSCYGSTGPLSMASNGQPYYHRFPHITIRDIVKTHILLKHHLNVQKIQCLIGASLGGQQSLEWSIMDSQSITNLILIATNAVHSPWGIAFNATQRMAIETDTTWVNYENNAGMSGLETARAIAMLSYRSYHSYDTTQKDDDQNLIHNHRADSYQRYQGKKLRQRFNAFSYYTLSKAMDSHNVARQRGSLAQALGTIQASTIVINIASDILFPLCEQQVIEQHIAGAKLFSIDSIFGHDGFLVETEKITGILQHLFTDQ